MFSWTFPTLRRKPKASSKRDKASSKIFTRSRRTLEKEVIHETSREQAENKFIQQSTHKSCELAKNTNLTFDYVKLHEILQQEFFASRQKEDSDKKFLRNDTIHQKELSDLLARSSLSALIFDAMTQAFIFYLRAEFDDNKLKQLLQEYYHKLATEPLVQQYIFAISRLEFSNPEIKLNMIRSLFYLMQSPKLCLQIFIKALPVELTAEGITFAAQVQQFFLLTSTLKEAKGFTVANISAKTVRELIKEEKVFITQLFSEYGDKCAASSNLENTHYAETADSNSEVNRSTHSFNNAKAKTRISELIQFFDHGAPGGIYRPDVESSVYEALRIRH